MVEIEESKKFMYDIVGAIYEVRNELGIGLNESCYQEALEMQLKEMNVAYERELSFHPCIMEKR